MVALETILEEGFFRSFLIEENNNYKDIHAFFSKNNFVRTTRLLFYQIYVQYVNRILTYANSFILMKAATSAAETSF